MDRFILAGCLLAMAAVGSANSNVSLPSAQEIANSSDTETTATSVSFNTLLTPARGNSANSTSQTKTESIMSTAMSTTSSSVASMENETTQTTEWLVITTDNGTFVDGSGMSTTEEATSQSTDQSTHRPTTISTSAVTTSTSATATSASATPSTFTTARTTSKIAPTPTTLTTETTRATTTTTTNGPATSDNTVLAVVLSLLAIIAVVFLVVLYFYCSKKPIPCLSNIQGRHEIIEIPSRKQSHVPKFAVGHMVISKEDFEGHYKRKVADDGRGYREEFKAVHTESSTMSAARDPVNAPKNRYDNVLPWDATRVVLSVPDGENGCSDYINANFVPGYLAEKKFIACQGPKETTCEDFWRMIWDQKSSTIVMTTNLIEAKKIKCHQYWPGDDTSTGESVTYGEFVVTVVDVKIRNYYVMRTFKLQWKKELSNQPRMVRQLHYTHWPDFGVPKNPHELLLFRRRVLAANQPHSGPIVVHCSAGVGRTGTFILIDAAMEQLNAEGKVDLFSFLTKMRKYRMMLVQTDAQYAFAHAAILEYIKYGDTEVPLKKFRTQVQSLREQKDGSEDNILDEQFSALLKVQMNKDNMKHGRSSIKKNRVLQIIPFDENRVTLPLKPGQEKSDYINASFIDGFKDRAAYIATQGPLAETASDFWAMTWMYQAHNIVMLTGLVEKGHEMCTQYWPEEVDSEKTFGDVNVKYVSKDDDDVVDYLVREFVVTNASMPDEEERKVRQFHYTGWPEVGLPTDAHGMIEIANRLTSKDKDGYNRPTIVHCSSGGGRTGVFIALNILMEQADADGLVDVFQAVKSLRAQRPHIIQTQEQLYFCYVALLQYLETNQLAGDNTTLTSNINSSIGNQSESVAASNNGVPVTSFLSVENTTPQGSMNNKLDANSVTDQGSVTDGKSGEAYGDAELDDGNAEVEATEGEVQSPSAGSGDSASQALLNDDNGASSSSQSDFEILNETGEQDPPVNV